uniref:Uncharacterized protein n=1 Tax=Brassica oleracea TaxID=3712 RepID=A0A3P6BEA0_BRAOL|nr:unnamed protein product [Brassica oleracea]
MKSQSKTNSGSRRSERGGKGVYVHNLGSITNDGNPSTILSC